MLELTFTQGNSLEESFFVAKDGERELKITCAEIMPKSVKEAIIKAASEKKLPSDVSTPEEVLTILKDESGGSFEKFTELVSELKSEAAQEEAEPEIKIETTETKVEEAKPGIKAEAIAGATGGAKGLTQSFDEKEVPKQAIKGENVVWPSSAKEIEKDAADLGRGKSTKVKSYFGRLPASSQVGTPAVLSLNLQSKILSEKYALVKQALQEEKEKSIDLKKKLDETTEKVDIAEKTKIISTIIATLKATCPLAKDTEERIKKVLSGVDKKALLAFNEVAEVLAEAKGAEAPKDALMKEDIPLKEEKEIKKASLQVPQVYLSEGVIGIDKLSQIFE